MSTFSHVTAGRGENLEQRAGYDIWLLLAALGIAVFGAIFVLTSSAVHAWQFHLGQIGAIFWNHSARLAIGGVLLVAMMFLDYHLLSKLSRVALGLSLAMLIAVLFVKQPGGATAHRWLTVFGFSFQPAELAKFSVIAYFATRQAEYELKPDMTQQKLYLGFGIAIVAIVALILLEPNLSMATLVLGTSCILVYLTGVRVKPVVLPAMGLGAVMMVVAWFTPYMRARLDSYIAGIIDPLSSSYHVKQSLIGIGQGGLTGVGLGSSTQKHFFLPEPFKDFIFSIVGEEWGFVGATALIALYVVLLARAWRIARRAPDTFGFYLAAGVTASLALSTMVNVGVTLGVLPATGQPLPLFSYGGSSLLMTMGSIGVLLNISRQIQKQSSFA